MNLTEKEVKALMATDAYRNKYHAEHEKVVKRVDDAWESLYPNDSMNKEPEKYYIWRAVGDSKTRSSHAERNGKIFSWSNPPEGGHPGEEHNCRCKAEAYIPPLDRYHESKGQDIKYLTFDGNNLTLHKNGRVERTWSAMSGQKGYQEKQFMSLSERGPIPEGDWVIKQKDFEAWDEEDKRSWLNKQRGSKNWREDAASWGSFRVQIRPMKGTKTQGRTEIFLHGGDVPGSAGCIDLTSGMDEFVNYFIEYEDDMIIKVRYPKDKW